jgi:hypothetical protein
MTGINKVIPGGPRWIAWVENKFENKLVFKTGSALEFY